MGGNFEKTPLNAKVLGSTQLDGFRIEKILYESQPNFPVTALLYLPDNKTEKLPATVTAPGHAATGKAATSPSPPPSRATDSQSSLTTPSARASACSIPTQRILHPN